MVFLWEHHGKGIDLSMNWQGAAGVYNSYNEVFTEVGPFNGGAVLDMYKDRWHTVNVNDATGGIRILNG